MSNFSACASADCKESLRANQPVVTWGVFFFVALASSIIGAHCQRLGLPSISGYLITGIICGPDVLQIFQRQELSRLSYVNDFVIAFISISSGAELYIPHVKELLISVLVNTAAIGFLTLPLCMLVGFGMGGTVLLSWPGDYSADCQWAMAAVSGGIFMGRSPASIIAIIAELKVRLKTAQIPLHPPLTARARIPISSPAPQAKGELTSTMLGITVCSDVLVLVVVTIMSSIAAASCSSSGFDGDGIGIVVVRPRRAFAFHAIDLIC
jgi:Kef-type K+ transport system membrane component KefB